MSAGVVDRGGKGGRGEGGLEGGEDVKGEDKWAGSLRKRYENVEIYMTGSKLKNGEIEKGEIEKGEIEKG